MADSDVFSWRASASFVTGRSNAKFGYQGQFVVNHFPNSILNDTWTSYRFNNGIPQSADTDGRAGAGEHASADDVALRAGPVDASQRSRCRAPFATTTRRASSPQQQVGPNPFILAPTVFRAQDGTSYSDITPRVGVAYDVFGNGKTAVKVNVGKYLAAADGSSITGLADQSAVAHLHERHPDVDRRERQFQAGLRPEQRLDAGSPGRRAATSAGRSAT